MDRIFISDEEGLLNAFEDVLAIPLDSEDDFLSDDENEEKSSTVLPTSQEEIKPQLAFNFLSDGDCDSSLHVVQDQISENTTTQVQAPIKTYDTDQLSPSFSTDENQLVPRNNENSGVNFRNLVWKKKNLQKSQDEILFSKYANLPEDLVSLETPNQFFKYFFNDELMDKILLETHRYSIQKDPAKSFVISKVELQQYLGICVLMSVTHVPNVRNYWNNVIGNSLIMETMSCNAFEKIRSFLHCNDNFTFVQSGQPNHDRLDKVRPIIDHFNQRASLIPYEECLAVDEQLCATKARHYLKQYMPAKPHKWGYKLFVLSGTDGFAYRIEVYSGLENDPVLRANAGEIDLGACANVVMRLSRDIPHNKHHKLYFDNYYTTLGLIVELEKKGIHMDGRKRALLLALTMFL